MEFYSEYGPEKATLVILGKMVLKRFVSDTGENSSVHSLLRSSGRQLHVDTITLLERWS